MEIKNTKQLKDAIRQKYAWPGGYPMFFITKDGGVLSVDSAHDNYRYIASAIKNNDDPQWHVVAVEINYEDNSLYCAHSGELIECAYSD